MSTEPHILRFGATTCTIGRSWCVTELPSGAERHAHPHDSVEQRTIAQTMGYGADLAALTREHDPTHAWLAHTLGLPASIALSAQAGEPADPHLAALEENAVLAIQALCRALGRMPWQ